jgi:hypothetical protein
MGRAAFAEKVRQPQQDTASPDPALAGIMRELDRLRRENRRLAVSLGSFSAFVASRGLLEEAWDYVHRVHQLEEEEE